MGYHYRNSTERIVFLEKRTRDCSPGLLHPAGKGRKLQMPFKDVLYAPRVDGAYPTEKPVCLLEKLILNSTRPGERCLDPFAGSGSTGEAALRLERGCVLGDVSESSMSWIEKRLGVSSAPVGAVFSP